MCFFAKRDIKKGAELMFNYNWIKEMGKGPTKCLCGKDNAVDILKSK
jgi:SET domain-containing protein